MSVAKEDYDEAGFLLFHEDSFLMATSNNSLEYFSNTNSETTVKIENGDPLTSAYNNLTEKVGGEFLDNDWRSRIKVLHVPKLSTKRWAWICLLKINNSEYNKLAALDSMLDMWNHMVPRNFKDVTKRDVVVNKSVDTIMKVSIIELMMFLCRYQQSSLNANCYSLQNRIKTARISDNKFTMLGVKTENIVYLEKHINSLCQHTD